MRLLEWEAESPVVTGRAYKRATGRTVELGLAQVKAGLTFGASQLISADRVGRAARVVWPVSPWPCGTRPGTA